LPSSPKLRPVPIRRTGHSRFLSRGRPSLLYLPLFVLPIPATLSPTGSPFNHRDAFPHPSRYKCQRGPFDCASPTPAAFFLRFCFRPHPRFFRSSHRPSPTRLLCWHIRLKRSCRRSFHCCAILSQPGSFSAPNSRSCLWRFFFGEAVHISWPGLVASLSRYVAPST